MASVKISELNEILVVSSDDFIPIVDSGSGTTYRVTFNILNDWMAAYGSASHAAIADFAWLAHTASYTKSSSYSFYAVSASRADTASYYDVSGFTPTNATNAINALTASMLSGSGTSWERNLQISGSLVLSQSAQFIIPMKTDISDYKNCIFFQGGTNSGGTNIGANDFAKLYFIEETTDRGHVRFDHLDNADTQVPLGPNIDYQYTIKPGYGWFTGPDYATNATGSLMFLATTGELYVRKIEARNFTASVSGMGFQGNLQGTASWATNLVGGVGTAVEPPVGAIMDYAGTSAPADPNWHLCDGTALPQGSYPALWAAIGTTWGTSGGNVVLPDLRKRMTIGAGTAGNYLGSVGQRGGSENLNNHYHLIGQARKGIWPDGSSRNDDVNFVWINNQGVNMASDFPRMLAPNGTYSAAYYLTGDDSHERWQPNSNFGNGANGAFVLGSSFGFVVGVANHADINPPYAVCNKIIRVS